MKKYRVWVKTNKIGSLCEIEVELTDDVVGDDVTETLLQYLFEHDLIQWDYDEICD